MWFYACDGVCSSVESMSIMLITQLCKQTPERQLYKDFLLVNVLSAAHSSWQVRTRSLLLLFLSFLFCVFCCYFLFVHFSICIYLSPGISQKARLVLLNISLGFIADVPHGFLGQNIGCSSGARLYSGSILLVTLTCWMFAFW